MQEGLWTWHTTTQSGQDLWGSFALWSVCGAALLNKISPIKQWLRPTAEEYRPGSGRLDIWDKTGAYGDA